MVESAVTRCPRCQGLIVFDEAIDEEAALLILRCVNCGQVSEQTVNRNRALSPRPDRERNLLSPKFTPIRRPLA